MANIDALSARQIAAGIAAGEFTAVEIAEASLAAVEAREPEVQAFLEVSSELALEAARATDAARAAGQPLGPMAGVPVAFKDNMHLLGTHTTCASRMLENYESIFTATCVQRMLDAGCTPIGKANMDEFAFGSSTETSYFHNTNNPWDTDRVPGGSSGGSAAAVAAGEVTVSLGSDTGGSIRQPASLCGIVGLKPTYGAVSRYGVVAFGSSLDQVGPFGRRVEDVALAMNALCGPGSDPFDSTSQDCPVDFLEHLEEPIEGCTVGVVPELMEHHRAYFLLRKVPKQGFAQDNHLPARKTGHEGKHFPCVIQDRADSDIAPPVCPEKPPEPQAKAALRQGLEGAFKPDSPDHPSCRQENHDAGCDPKPGSEVSGTVCRGHPQQQGNRRKVNQAGQNKIQYVCDFKQSDFMPD